MRAGLTAVLAVLVATAAIAATALGPGDPTSVVVDGFTTPCRTTVGPDGSLYVVDFGDGLIYRVTPDGTKSLFNDDVADPRGIAFDSWDYLLVPDRDDGSVWRVSPDGVASPFLTGLTRPIRARVGPAGDIWVAAADSVYQFDAMGRLLARIDVIGQGQAAYGLQFNPDGVLYITSWPGFSTLVDGIVTPVPITEPMRNGAPHFDTAGNAYFVHESVDEADTHRMVYVGPDMTVIDETFASFSEGPCALVFGRDATGATTNRQLVSLRNGTIVEVNATGVPAPGVPETGLRLANIGESEVIDELMLQQSALTGEEVYFLDVIGNNDDGFDVGDTRAYLVATGIVE